MIDLHAHLDFNIFDNSRSKIIKNLDYILNPGSDFKSNFRILKIAKEYKNIIPVLGIHPISELEEKNTEILIKLIIENKENIYGIGEVGLDYHWDHNKHDIQKENFVKWINIANDLKKPLIIHLRKPEAINDGLKILNKHANVPVILHCWSGNITQTKEALDLDYYFSIATNSIMNKKKYSKLIKIIPLEKIFCETDSPYLWTSYPNTPENVKYVYNLISEIKQIALEEVEKNVYSRFVKIFNL